MTTSDQGSLHPRSQDLGIDGSKKSSREFGLEVQQKLVTIDTLTAILGILEDDVAEGLAPMVRRLDLQMGESVSSVAGPAEPDGFDGIDRRGPLDRLLLSDWHLAECEPEEFLRRFAFAELSFLRMAYTEPKPPSRVVVICDAGPEQLGAPRLAQLAGLVVLARRASASKVPLELGFFGDNAGEFITGVLPELFTYWLNARRSCQPGSAGLTEWLEHIETDATVWLFGAPNVDAKVRRQEGTSGKVRHLHARETMWSANGAEMLEASVDGRTLELPLPEPAACVRLLRGHGIRRVKGPTTSTTKQGIRFPQMSSSKPCIVGRGASDSDVIFAHFPLEELQSARRTKHRQFAGPVLAAGFLGGRTVALVAVANRLRVVVIGKHLGNVAQINPELQDLDLTYDRIRSICEGRLGNLYYDHGAIIVEVGEVWWRLDVVQGVSKLDCAAVAASRTLDQPRLAIHTETGLRVTGRHLSFEAPKGARVLLGPSASVAVEVAPGEWSVSSGFAESLVVRLDRGVSVEGLTVIGNEPLLVTRSPGGHITRLNGSNTQTTLTRYSANLESIATHPTMPIALFERTGGSIDVVELSSMTLLGRVQVRSG